MMDSRFSVNPFWNAIATNNKAYYYYCTAKAALWSQSIMVRKNGATIGTRSSKRLNSNGTTWTEPPPISTNAQPNAVPPPTQAGKPPPPPIPPTSDIPNQFGITSCPECNTTFDEFHHRPVLDACGHTKCVACLVEFRHVCRQCKRKLGGTSTTRPIPTRMAPQIHIPSSNALLLGSSVSNNLTNTLSAIRSVIAGTGGGNRRNSSKRRNHVNSVHPDTSILCPNSEHTTTHNGYGNGAKRCRRRGPNRPQEYFATSISGPGPTNSTNCNNSINIEVVNGSITTCMSTPAPPRNGITIHRVNYEAQQPFDSIQSNNVVPRSSSSNYYNPNSLPPGVNNVINPPWTTSIEGVGHLNHVQVRNSSHISDDFEESQLGTICPAQLQQLQIPNQIHANNISEEYPGPSCDNSNSTTEGVADTSTQRTETGGVEKKKKKRSPVFIHEHIKVLSGDPQMYQCSICTKKFKTKAHIKYHEFCINQDKPFTCKQCGQGFIAKSHYEYHLRTHTGERPYVCTKCGKGFNQRGKVTRHMRSHTGEKPFHCETCGRGFANAQAMRSHFLIHTGERPFACEHCNKRFTGMTNLKKHIITHTGERPFTCVHCGKSFGLKWTLDLHMKTHSSERPYPCSECSRAFSNTKDLRRHYAIHSDERPFSCCLCGTAFRRKDNLDRHIRNTHSQPKEVAKGLANQAAAEYLASTKAAAVNNNVLQSDGAVASSSTASSLISISPTLTTSRTKSPSATRKSKSKSTSQPLATSTPTEFLSSTNNQTDEPPLDNSDLYILPNDRLDHLDVPTFSNQEAELVETETKPNIPHDEDSSSSTELYTELQPVEDETANTSATSEAPTEELQENVELKTAILNEEHEHNEDDEDKGTKAREPEFPREICAIPLPATPPHEIKYNYNEASTAITASGEDDVEESVQESKSESCTLPEVQKQETNDYNVSTVTAVLLAQPNSDNTSPVLTVSYEDNVDEAVKESEPEFCIKPILEAPNQETDKISTPATASGEHNMDVTVKESEPDSCTMPVPDAPKQETNENPSALTTTTPSEEDKMDKAVKEAEPESTNIETNDNLITHTTPSEEDNMDLAVKEAETWSENQDASDNLITLTKTPSEEDNMDKAVKEAEPESANKETNDDLITLTTPSEEDNMDLAVKEAEPESTNIETNDNLITHTTPSEEDNMDLTVKEVDPEHANKEPNDDLITIIKTPIEEDNMDLAVKEAETGSENQEASDNLITLIKTPSEEDNMDKAVKEAEPESANKETNDDLITLTTPSEEDNMDLAVKEAEPESTNIETNDNLITHTTPSEEDNMDLTAKEVDPEHANKEPNDDLITIIKTPSEEDNMDLALKSEPEHANQEAKDSLITLATPSEEDNMDLALKSEPERANQEANDLITLTTPSEEDNMDLTVNEAKPESANQETNDNLINPITPCEEDNMDLTVKEVDPEHANQEANGNLITLIKTPSEEDNMDKAVKEAEPENANQETNDSLITLATPSEEDNMDLALKSEPEHANQEAKDSLITLATPSEEDNMDLALKSEPEHANQEAKDSLITLATPSEEGNMDLALKSEPERANQEANDLIALTTPSEEDNMDLTVNEAKPESANQETNDNLITLTTPSEEDNMDLTVNEAKPESWTVQVPDAPSRETIDNPSTLTAVSLVAPPNSGNSPVLHELLPVSPINLAPSSSYFGFEEFIRDIHYEGQPWEYTGAVPEGYEIADGDQHIPPTTEVLMPRADVLTDPFADGVVLLCAYSESTAIPDYPGAQMLHICESLGYRLDATGKTEFVYAYARGDQIVNKDPGCTIDVHILTTSTVVEGGLVMEDGKPLFSGRIGVNRYNDYTLQLPTFTREYSTGKRIITMLSPDPTHLELILEFPAFHYMLREEYLCQENKIVYVDEEMDTSTNAEHADTTQEQEEVAYDLSASSAKKRKMTKSDHNQQQHQEASCSTSTSSYPNQLAIIESVSSSPAGNNTNAVAVCDNLNSKETRIMNLAKAIATVGAEHRTAAAEHAREMAYKKIRLETEAHRRLSAMHSLFKQPPPLN